MLLDAGADCSFVDNSGRTARDWVKLWSPEAVDADGRAVISLLEARYRRRVARRRWKVFGRSVEALLSLWALIKERRYAPDGAGFEVARMHFEDCRTAMEQGGDTYRVSARRETTPIAQDHGRVARTVQQTGSPKRKELGRAGIFLDHRYTSREYYYNFPFV